MNPEDKTIIEIPENTAQGIIPNSVFENELEERLTAAHKPKRDLHASLRQNFFPTLGWTVALVVLVFTLHWATRSLLSSMPAAGNGFICPVTKPNGSLPPDETVASTEYLGNGQLRTALWPDGKVRMELADQAADGSLSMKWGWWRKVTGPLTIEGHRLDAEAEPLRANIPDGYGDTGFQVSALIFPTTGCWEVTGRAGDASLTFVTEVLFEDVTPTPEAQINGTPTAQADATALPQGDPYEWNGSTIYLNTALPEEVPSEMKIYLAHDEIRASVDDVRVLANRFNMNGEIYETPGEIPDTTDYLMIEGNRQLRVRSDRYYIYYPNYAEYAAITTTSINPNEELLAKEFLQTYRFNEKYQFDFSNPYRVDVLPLTLDGYPIREGSYIDNGLMFLFNQDGIISVSANFIQYDEVKPVSIISAQEAFDRFLAPVPQYESLMSVTPKLVPTKTWRRLRPLNETITYYGWLTSTGKSVSGGAPYIALNSYPVRRFYGRYSYGDEFEILMQALKDEHLLPTHINEP